MLSLRRSLLAVTAAVVIALDVLALTQAAPAARAALPTDFATPAPTTAVTSGPVPSLSPTASPSPTPTARPARTAWVAVPVANVWTHLASPRHVDRLSLLARPNMRGWFRAQTLAQRLDLDSRLMTQVLRGERVVVLSSSRGFAHIRIPDQTGSAYPNGIIGWVAGRQLSSVAVPHVSMSQRRSVANEIRTARSYLGVQYLWAGMSKSGIDCSGLIYRSFLAMGVVLPRDAADQSRVGRAVSRRSLRPGDVVFFGPGGWQSIHHVGIYIGRGLVLHAPHTGARVTITPLRSWHDYWGARRIV